MNNVNSPFLGEINALRTKSRNIRKRIYKYLQAHQPQAYPKVNKKIKTLVPDMSLPQPISMQLEEVQLSSLSNLENITFQTGIDHEQLKKMVNKQERDVANITRFSAPVYKTAQKRRPLAEIKTQHQTGTQKALMFTTENEESGNLSLQVDFCSDISIFKGIDDIQQPKSSEDLQPIKLKENVSMFQLEHRCSNIIISSSMFDDPMQADMLNFI